MQGNDKLILRRSHVIIIISSDLFHCSESDKACIFLYLLNCFDEDDSCHCSALHRGEDVKELDKKAGTAVCEQPMVAIRAAADGSSTVFL